MNAKIKEWIKHNCQQTPTKQRLEFNVNPSGETFEMYLKDDFQGYLTDDIEDILGNDCIWAPLGDDLYICNDQVEVGIINTPITNQVLY